MYGGGFNNYNQNNNFQQQQQNRYTPALQRNTPTTFNNDAARATPSWANSTGMMNNDYSQNNWTQVGGRNDNYTPTPMTNMDARATPSTLAMARSTPPPPRKGTTQPPSNYTSQAAGMDMGMGMGMNNGMGMDMPVSKPQPTPMPQEQTGGNLDVNSAQKVLAIRGRDFYRAASMSFPAGQKPWEMDNNMGGGMEMKQQKNMNMNDAMNNGMGMGMNNGMGMGMNNGMGMGMGGMNNGMMGGMGMGMNNGMGMNSGMGMNMNTNKNGAPYQEHQGAAAQYLRDIVLGLNDGLVSVLLLTLGLAGGNLTTTQILLAGLTGALAGAISMALGEYIATKSQSQVTHAELTLENEHLLHHRAKEIGQVRAFMQELNVKGDLLDKVASAICQRDEAMIRLMMAFEFGFQEELERSPIKAMLTSGGLFITGSLPAFLPYAMTTNVGTALGISIALSCVGLFALGAGKTVVTKGNWLYDGMEVLILGALGGGVTFGLGQAYRAGTGV